MFLLISASAPKTPARWSAEINDEWTRNLARNRPDIESKIPLLLEQVNRSVPDCLVENYAFMVESLALPDPDDRHVLAAAIVGHADAIVISNLKDFPADVLAVAWH